MSPAAREGVLEYLSDTQSAVTQEPVRVRKYFVSSSSRLWAQNVQAQLPDVSTETSYILSASADQKLGLWSADADKMRKRRAAD